jgi:hypothetical protein
MSQAFTAKQLCCQALALALIFADRADMELGGLS